MEERTEVMKGHLARAEEAVRLIERALKLVKGDLLQCYRFCDECLRRNLSGDIYVLEADRESELCDAIDALCDAIQELNGERWELRGLRERVKKYQAMQEEKKNADTP